MAPQYVKSQPAGFVNSVNRVAIVGAGGRIGSAMTRELIKAGKTVTALTRAESNSKLPEGVNAVVVNYNEEESIISALKGQDFFIITLAVSADRDAQTKLIKAAAKAGIKYVMPNIYGPDSMENKSLGTESGLGARRVYIEQISAEGMQSICLVCGFWYELSLGTGEDAFGFDVARRTAVFLNGGDIKINTSTWDQCGRAVAALVSLPILPQDESDKSPTMSQYLDGMLYISSFRISQREMFESLKRVTGTTDTDWTITQASAQERWQAAVDKLTTGDRSGFIARMYTRIWFNDKDGDYETTKGLANNVLRLPNEDLDKATKTAVQLVESKEEYPNPH